jgi:hypothetical protein
MNKTVTKIQAEEITKIRHTAIVVISSISRANGLIYHFISCLVLSVLFLFHYLCNMA